MAKRAFTRRLSKETQRNIKFAVLTAYAGIAIMGMSNLAHNASEALSANLRAKINYAQSYTLASAK
ncbi:MAG: hypothetical protein K2X77_00080 [Candidatus Obscuribacterales bacterium]|nr:hypothetical protein [Candidatus Obscuribacterales bacterium]